MREYPARRVAAGERKKMKLERAEEMLTPGLPMQTPVPWQKRLMDVSDFEDPQPHDKNKLVSV